MHEHSKTNTTEVEMGYCTMRDAVQHERVTLSTDSNVQGKHEEWGD